MPASLFGYGQSLPPKNRRRWVAWLVGVLIVLLAVAIPCVVGSVIAWIAVAEGTGGVAEAVGPTLLGALMIFLLAVVAVGAPESWRAMGERDAPRGD